ncbi:hypothetical protein BDV26DRAFT_284399 [Aspergillus bertholletiae]|uniref:Uncharacterized protein n=1 Tax=Aspergillus bertholletiae TaxID=1226010 RepID=A0A5N7AZG8_9EURO|nr:hypothetical protein BDV26DRAFT_284399 [Aspergillus bertholletiae]
MATITYTAASTKASNVPRLRIMAAGKCTAELTSGKIRVPCPCAKGMFKIDLTADPLTKCMDNINFCPRQDTVAKLIDLINLYHIIHIRGTPASGKTTLAQLICNSLQDQGYLVFFLYNWQQQLYEVDPADPWNALKKVLRQSYSDISIPNCPGNDAVMILDEAQGSYKDIYLWNSIIKPMSDNPSIFNLRILLFCSFGNPSTGVEKSDFYTPVRIPRRQRITLTSQSDEESPQIGLFYTESEFNDVLSRQVRYEFPNIAVTFDNEAKGYVFSLTNGHPGGVAETIRFLCKEYRAKIKHDEKFVISKHHIIDILDNNEESFFKFLENSGSARCFPEAKDLNPATRDILYQIAEEGRIIWEPERPELENCYRGGLVHRMIAVDNSYEVAVLPSRLHEKWLQSFIGKDKKVLPPHFTNLTQLCMTILSKFSRMNLKHSITGKIMSTAAQPRPIEAQYQDEFYRAFNKVAGRGVPISTEWARTTSGRVDFYIPEKKWAVELLRDYDRVDSHIKRFKKGGQYFQWLEEKAIDDWVIINCATTAPTAVYNDSHLFHAVFQNNYTELQVFNHKGESLCDVICLMN